MSDPSPNPVPHPRVSDAVLRWQRRQRAPRRMSPMDEFSWFETPVITQYGQDGASVVPTVAQANVNRVALIFSNLSPFVFHLEQQGQQSGNNQNWFGSANGYYANTGYRVAPAGGAAWNTDIYLLPGGGAKPFQNIPFPPPNSIVLHPWSDPLVLTQADFGPLVQGKWDAVIQISSYLTVTEIVLRDWPQHEE